MTAQLREISRLHEAILSGYQARQSPRTVAEYAEAHIVLSGDTPFPGPYRFQRMALWRGVADALSPQDPCHKITIMGPVQSGKSTLVNAALGFYVDASPSPCALVLPTAEDAPGYQKERLGKLYKASPRLRRIAGKRVSKDLQDNAQVTDFVTGARLTLMGAAAKGTYRQRTFRFMVLDDLDSYVPAPEGSHVKLAEGRTGPYRLLGRKLLSVSSPGELPSAIAREYEQSSKEQYWVPCPYCGEFQVLDPVRLIWEPKLPSTAHMVCAYSDCGERIKQESIPAMNRRGEWRALRPQRKATHRGFWVWQGYVPVEFCSWGEYAEASIESMRALREDNDEGARRTFVNIRNARPWEPAANRKLNAVAAAAYQLREEPWSDDHLPIAARTMATDCQHDRLESTTVGWGKGLEAWVLAHAVHQGSIHDDEVWDQAAEHTMASGARVWVVDAGDGEAHNQICAQLTRLYPTLMDAGVMPFAIKNFAGTGRLWPKAVHPGNPKGGRCAPVSIYADAAIGWVYEGLIKEPRRGPGVLHVPKRHELGRKWFQQVFTKRRRTSSDRPGKSPWTKPKKKARDEALDCLYLSRVAIEVLLVADERGNSLLPAVREQLIGVVADAPVKPPPQAVRRPRKPKKGRRRGVF